MVWGEAAQLVMGAVGFAGDLSSRAASFCSVAMSTFSLLWSPADQVNPSRNGCRVGVFFFFFCLNLGVIPISAV